MIKKELPEAPNLVFWHLTSNIGSESQKQTPMETVSELNVFIFI